MKHRLLSLMLVLALCLCLAAPALADQGPEDPAAESCFWVIDEAVRYSYAEDARGDGWAYAAAARTLTLDGFQPEGEDNRIYFQNPEEDVTVFLAAGSVNSAAVWLTDRRYEADPESVTGVTLRFDGEGTLNGTVTCQARISVDRCTLNLWNLHAIWSFTMNSGAINANFFALRCEDANALRMQGGTIHLTNTTGFETVILMEAPDAPPDLSGCRIADAAGAPVTLERNAACQHLSTRVPELTITALDAPGQAPSFWAAAEVDAAVAAGLVPVSLRRNYQDLISRSAVCGMFTGLIEQVAGQSVESLLAERGLAADPDAFADTADPAVLAMHALGVIKGTGDRRFSPDGALTRAQIAAILNRIAGLFGVDTGGYSHSFTDVDGHWVSSELGWPSSAGIILGVGGGRFDPDGGLTTEQAILITWRALGALLDEVQQGLFDKALANKQSRTYTATTLEEAKEKVANRAGLVKMMWCGDEACEDKVKEVTGMGSRCIPFEQEHISDVCPCCGKPAKHMVYWGFAY